MIIYNSTNYLVRILSYVKNNIVSYLDFRNILDTNIVNKNIVDDTENRLNFIRNILKTNLDNAKKYIIDDLDYTEKNEFIKNRVNYNLEYIDNNLKIFSNDIKNKIKILADNLFNATCDDLCKIFLDNTENDIKNFFNYIVEYKKNIEIKNNFDSSTNFDDMLEFI